MAPTGLTNDAIIAIVLNMIRLLPRLGHSFGPRASKSGGYTARRALMSLSAQDARGPEDTILRIANSRSFAKAKC